MGVSLKEIFWESLQGEKIHNPNFNYGEFAVIKSQAGLNSYKLSVKEWSEKRPSVLGGVKMRYDIGF